MQEVRSLFTKRHISAFRRSIPMEALAKAFLITMLSLLLVCACTFFLCILEPEYTFLQLLFEEVSAFGTVGLSTGITPVFGVGGQAGAHYHHVRRPGWAPLPCCPSGLSARPPRPATPRSPSPSGKPFLI